MENPKKILIFSTAYYPFVGGAEVAIKEITDRIPDVQFDLITAKMKKGLPFREKIGNVTVYRLGVGIPFVDKLIAPFEGALFARHLLKKKTYTAFWCMMASFTPGGAFIYNLLFSPKVPIILTLQEGDSERYLKMKWGGLVDLSWRLALIKTHTLTVISNYLGERAKRLGYKGKVELIPNGVDVAKFTEEITPEKRKEIRSDWSFSDTDTVLITSSRLNVKNGVGDVIVALSKLPENVKFVICGTGELEDRLKLKVKSLNFDKRVRFLGLVSHDILPKYLKASDVFIRASLSEGMGNSFIEAMVAGLPTIGTPVGGIVDFLKEGETGYLCQPENSESIAETIQRVISDPNKEKVLENGKRLVIEQYNWQNLSVQMEQVFGTMTR